MFSRFGIPDTIVSDNGPQFSSDEFATFCQKWSIEHVTSSPHYPQSNGKAENAVKTVKKLFNKCKSSGQSEYLALLDWRNTASEGMKTSPAQRLMGRRSKTLLLTPTTLLQPLYNTRDDLLALLKQKKKQRHHYDKRAKPLKPLLPGDSVWLRLPEQSTWSRGTCKQQMAPCSYHAEWNGNIYRRNRHDLKKTKQDPLLEMTALRNNEQTTVSYSITRRPNCISKPPECLIITHRLPVRALN